MQAIEKKEVPKITLSTEIPDIYYRLKNAFGVDWNDCIIICDGDTIHCKREVPPEKLVHEVEHVKRQKIYGKDLWWDRYLTDKDFRLNEELIAYRAEYAFIVRNIRDRNARFAFLYEMARSLSGHTYGNIITGSEAMKEIANIKT